jgi:hypothetical protein
VNYPDDSFVENRNKAILRSDYPFRLGKWWINPGLAEACGLVALGAVCSVEALADYFRIGRSNWSCVYWAPSDLAWVINIPAKSTAIVKKISTRPKGKNDTET